MTMRLINADDLKKLMEEECAEECAICCYANSGDGCSCNLIDNAPTVELTEEQAIDKLHETGWLIRHDKEMTERPHGDRWGKWVQDDWNKIIECNLCHGQAPVCVTSAEQYQSKFCPKCGAQMEEGDF